MSVFFTESTVKNPLEYRCGETIEFDLQLTRDGENIGCLR